MPRDYKIYLRDIIESIEKIQDYTAGLSLVDFCNDGKTIDAVIRNLEIIGEAARRLPEEFRIKFPDVEWRRIVSLRNIFMNIPGSTWRLFGTSLKISFRHWKSMLTKF